MLRKMLSLILLAGLALGWVAQPVQAKSYAAERFDVQIDIQPDGSFFVTETVVFHFSGGEYTYAFREIPRVELDQLNFIDAGMDGVPMPEGTGAGQVEVIHGDPLSVKWHFAPASDISHEFTLRYRVEGNMRPTPAGDTLFWQAIPADHEYPIQAATVTINYPSIFVPSDLKIRGGSASAETSPGKVVWQLGAVDENQEVVVGLSLPAGSLQTQAPLWWSMAAKRSAELRQTLPVAGGLGGLLLVLGGLGIARWRRKFGRQPEPAIPLGYVTSPPDEASPAEVGLLASNGRADYRMAMATLFDLARRGWLDINEQEKPAFLIKAKEYLVTRLPLGSGSLRPHESTLLGIAYKNHTRGIDEVLFDELGKNLTQNFREFKNSLEETAAASGMLDLERLKKRGRATIFATLITIFCFLLLFASLIVMFPAGQAALGLILIVIFGSASLLGIVLMITSSGMDVLTAKGVQQKVRWKAFDRYLESVTKSPESLQIDWLDRYLAYALVFNTAEAFFKAFRAQGMQTRVAWLHLLPGSDDGGMGFISSVSSFSSGGDGGGGGGGGGGGSSGAG